METQTGSKKWWIVGGMFVVVIILVAYGLSKGNAVPPNGTTPDPALGSENPVIRIREYSDFQCPACRAAHPDLMKFVEAHPNEVRLEVNDFPLPQHLNARVAAYAANCALAQNKYWPFANMLFDKQSEWSGLGNPLDKFKEYFKSVGGDEAALSTCTNDRVYKGSVEEDINEGVSAGISATPTFFVNDERIVGGLDLSGWEAKLKSLGTSSGPKK